MEGTEKSETSYYSLSYRDRLQFTHHVVAFENVATANFTTANFTNDSDSDYVAICDSEFYKPSHLCFAVHMCPSPICDIRRPICDRPKKSHRK